VLVVGEEDAVRVAHALRGEPHDELLEVQLLLDGVRLVLVETRREDILNEASEPRGTGNLQLCVQKSLFIRYL
jgi:hypothetical protein